MIKIEPLTAESEPEYLRFLQEDARNLIYATPEFRDFLIEAASGSAHYILARDREGIAGCLPLMRTEIPQLGTIINSLPWYGTHGGCILAPRAGEPVRSALLHRYLDIIAEPGVLAATMVLSPQEDEVAEHYKALLSPAAIDSRIGQFTQLPAAGPEVEFRLERTFSQKTRNLVRKARKQGFVLTRSDAEWAWRFLYEVHHENMAAVGGRAKPWSHFSALRRQIPAAMRTLCVAMLHETPVAALLLLHFNRTTEYLTPVIRHDYRQLQPLSFLIWHAMREAIARGDTWWNWGGTWTTQMSLHHFKAGWGAHDRPYSYLVNASAHGLDTICAHRHLIQSTCPYYYLYPYALLDAYDAARPGRVR